MDRNLTSVGIADPVGWFWWPGSVELVRGDPDLSDGRAPRPISRCDVDWSLIFHAVRYAVASLPVEPARRLSLEKPFSVDVPFPLSHEEAQLAQSWVGSTPVTYWPDGEQVQDGRHRLWLSRACFASCDVPLFDEHLHYLRDVADGVLAPSLLADSIAQELAWWCGRSEVLRRPAEGHLAVLRYVHRHLARGLVPGQADGGAPRDLDTGQPPRGSDVVALLSTGRAARGDGAG